MNRAEEALRRVGDPALVRETFDASPGVLLAAVEGPHHVLVAANAAWREFVGRRDVIGMPVRQLVPEAAGQQLFEFLDRAYARGEPVTAREWRVQIGPGAPTSDRFLDFRLVPWRAADGTMRGLRTMAIDVTERVRERRATQRRAEVAERRFAAARDVVAELQEALLPTGLPVLPGVQVAARYLVAGHEQAAGGDWFDAVTLADMRLALVLGDVVGHGVGASAAMGQLRAVLNELLTAEPDLATVLSRVDAFASRHAALQATTLCVVVLEPDTGALEYATCGHPPPLVVAQDGVTRYLPGTRSGPLGTGSAAGAGDRHARAR
jgi:PAS domain S-box-containing protein